MSGVEYAYRYASPSAVRVDDARARLYLATSGGRTRLGADAQPRFFEGFLTAPDQAAVALLACARVARTRYYVPPGSAVRVAAADPVVTSNGDRLRFESFSACCGVYARFDIPPDGLDRPPVASGTTNVDFNPPMRAALARIHGQQPLNLHVGAEDVTVRTFGARVVERTVPLPERWLRGFAEVHLAAAGMRPRLELSAVEARRFIRALPSSKHALLWAVQNGRGARLTTLSGPDAVAIAGPDRLAALEPVLRFGSTLRAYGPELPDRAASASSTWEVTCAAARFTLTLSPEVTRGFSGEGGALFDLSDDRASDDAEVLAGLLAWEASIDVAALSRRAHLDEARVRRALTHLGAAGRVGYDLASGAYFQRELPYDAEALEAMHPRLRDARNLARQGAVRPGAGGALVASPLGDYRVTFATDVETCTCPWWGKHRGTRGPCKHVLAARLAQRG